MISTGNTLQCYNRLNYLSTLATLSNATRGVTIYLNWQHSLVLRQGDNIYLNWQHFPMLRQGTLFISTGNTLQCYNRGHYLSQLATLSNATTGDTIYLNWQHSPMLRQRALFISTGNTLQCYNRGHYLNWQHSPMLQQGTLFISTGNTLQCYDSAHYFPRTTLTSGSESPITGVATIMRNCE